MTNNNFKFDRKSIIGWVGRLVFSALIAAPFWWANSILKISDVWTWMLVLVVIASALPDALWVSRRRVSPAVLRVIAFALLIALPLLTDLDTTRQHPMMAGLYAITALVLLGLSFVYSRKSAAANIGLALMGVVFAVVIANVAAGMVINILEQPRTQQVPPTQQTEIVEATEIPAEPTDVPTEAPTEAATAIPEPTVDPDATPEPSATPAPELPIAGYGYMDFIEDGGEASWTQFTGFGPRVNSSAHVYMYDVNGQVVYDTTVEWNSKGMRGPDVSYEKPDDTYRILIIGDSFVEAIQQPYEQTFPALLQAELNERGGDQKYEVIAMGRTGWGTLHELIYYQVEGYKFDADLVILSFYINDVADTFPRVFYPNINNTNFEFVFEDSGEVRIVDTNNQPVPPNSARLLYNALPPFLQQTNLARLYVRTGDPPIPVITPGGVLTRVHPQYLIYVDEPEIEGYPEGWERTERGLRLLANEVQADGAEFAVMSISVGEDMVENVSYWYPDLTEGYQWNAERPDQMLEQILDGTGGSLIKTRPYYEDYADQMGRVLYDLIFLPEDQHFNALGHELTAGVIYEWLVDQGIVE